MLQIFNAGSDVFETISENVKHGDFNYSLQKKDSISTRNAVVQYKIKTQAS
jgi:hypothetical protein